MSGQTITLAGDQMVLNKNVTIDGLGLPNGIQINGNHASRIFTVANGSTVVLNSLTITNGYDTTGSGGGGIFNNSGNLTVNECTLAGNATTYYGGGIRNPAGSTLAVNQCTFEGNSATDGGGGIVSGGTAPSPKVPCRGIRAPPWAVEFIKSAPSRSKIPSLPITALQLTPTSMARSPAWA